MEKIKIDDMCRFKFLSNIELNNAKKFAAFQMHETSEDREGYVSETWVYNLEKDHFQKIFKGSRNYWWTGESSIVVQDKTEDGKALFKSIDIEADETKELFRINRGVNSITECEGERYLFTSTYNHSEEHSEEKIGNYVVVDEIPFWNNGSGYTNKNRNRLYIFSGETGSYEAITGPYMNVQKYSHRDGKVLILSKEYTEKELVENNLYLYDMDSKETVKLLEGSRWSISFAHFFNGNEVVFTGSTMEKHGDNENHKIYRMDINDGEVHMISKELNRSLWNTVGSDCRYGSSPIMKVMNGKLYFITSDDGHSYLNSIDRNGNMERVLSERGSVDSYDVQDDKVIFIGMRKSVLQEIYLKNGEEEERKSFFNEWVEKERFIAPLELISAESDPGITVDGWVMKPKDFKEGEKYPAILNIHGGPKSAFGEVFFHEMQYWASRGYVVFFCNLRGSNVRDDAYSDIRGQFGMVDYDDIMAFTDKVLEECPYIDKDRVGVTGGSYGGYMTNWIIGHTDRFKAAVSQRCISNWISKFNTTDIGYYWVKDQNGATPWSDVNKLWDHSPIKYADKVKTPTLFIHAEEDYRCYFAEGVQMFTALKYHGVESKMCIFKGENHELSRSGKPTQRIARLKEITEWFDNHL